MRRTKHSLRELWDNIKCTNIQIIEFSEELRGKENSQSSSRDTESPIQDKPKEKHIKTHTNQTNKY